MKVPGGLHALQAGQQWIASNKGYRHHVGHPGTMKSLFEVGVLNFGLNRNKGCRLAQNPLASITWIVVVITTVSSILSIRARLVVNIIDLGVSYVKHLTTF